jgi:hypothetical protein
VRVIVTPAPSARAARCSVHSVGVSVGAMATKKYLETRKRLIKKTLEGDCLSSYEVQKRRIIEGKC